jgi:hypothetical protein
MTSSEAMLSWSEAVLSWSEAVLAWSEAVLSWSEAMNDVGEVVLGMPACEFGVRRQLGPHFSPS